MKSFAIFIVGVIVGGLSFFGVLAYKVVSERDYVDCMLDRPRIDDTELC